MEEKRQRMGMREAPPFPPVKILLFEQEIAEGVNWRD
jgi:hypothetical protein